VIVRDTIEVENHRFLREFVYAGLKDLNTGFDSSLIGHLSRENFLVVIDRCEPLHVFASSKLRSSPQVGSCSKVEISPEDGYDWARRSGAICATIDVP
jgi:hypothetical protein